MVKKTITEYFQDTQEYYYDVTKRYVNGDTFSTHKVHFSSKGQQYEIRGLRTNILRSVQTDVAYRLDNFVVGLTNDDPATTAPVYLSSYTLCAQFSGSVAAGTDATVTCSPSSQRFRYVIVQGSHTVAKALCLTEVYVYPRSE